MAVVTSSNVLSVSSVNYDYNRRYIFLVSTVAALGGLLFGYDIANISGTIHFFREYFRLNEFQVGWAVGCISVGAAVGAMIAGKLSDMFGRRRVLLVSAVLFAITGIGTGWAGTFPLFIMFRMLSGLAIGCATVVCPIYIAEISPAPFRGKLVSYYQLAITIGVLLAFIANYFLLDTGENNWRWMFSSQSAPAIFFLLGLFFVIESPRWLVQRNREAEARAVLVRIGGTDFAESEITGIRRSFDSHRSKQSTRLFSKNLMPIVITGIGLAVFSQIGGPFTAYAPEIFKDAGVAQDSAFLRSIIIGLILVVFTLVAILTVEKAGRRDLMLYGVALLFLNTLGITLAFYFDLSGTWILMFALVFTAVYAATVGPVTWVVLSEVFPNRIRGNAMSTATLALWISNFLNNASFPILKSQFGITMAFGIYIPLFLVNFFFIYFRIPETKGRSLEEIEALVTKKTENV